MRNLQNKRNLLHRAENKYFNAVEELQGKKVLLTKGSALGYWVKVIGTFDDRIRVCNLKNGNISSVYAFHVADVE